MSVSPLGRKAIWLLPVVIAVCAVMVLPGGTFVASSSHGGNPMASAAGVSAVPPTALPSVNTPSHSASASAVPSTVTPSSVPYSSLVPKQSQYSPTSGPTGLASLASNLPSYLDNVPWLQAVLHPGSSSIRPTVSLPNLDPLLHPPTAVNGVFYPADTAQPVPMGVADYGLGVTPYSYNTSHIMGQVTFNAPPNATQPDGAFIINPTVVGERLGYVGSQYEFGLQLNTIGINLTIPGTNDQGYVWAQNVVNWNDSGIHFIQDTWNFSLNSDTRWQLNSIYSGCGGDEGYANYILEVYGFVLQCSYGNIPITAADYPVTISLFNNFTTNSDDQSQLVYGYSVYEAGSGETFSGAFPVVFNNPTAGVPPPNLPGNTIDPFSVTPTFGPDYGYWQDAEMDIVGGIEGDNAVFSSINGTVGLEYSNESAGGWNTVPSAYNFGTDTGETSTGIASYWTPSHTLVINQGPEMLYGLWNAEPQSSVPSGDIHIQGSISPSYGFVFMSNTAPVLDPWNGVERDNMSWLPTTSTGVFNTYLPPLGAPWTTTYYVQAFAAGSAEYNGTVTGSTTSLSISLTAAAGVLRAPLYMSSAAQASALAQALGGSAGPPYTFSNLVVNVNFTFDHLNDWDFPSFELFESQGVSSVTVDNVTLGNDSYDSGNSYIGDFPSIVGTGMLVPGPVVFLDIGPYTQGIDIYFGTGDEVVDQTLYTLFGGIGEPGGSQINLWSDTDATVTGTLCEDEEPGVWVGDSLDTAVTDTVAEGSIGVTDIGSTGTIVTNLLAEDGSLGISTTASVGATYSWINVTGSEGIEAGTDYELGPTFAFWGASGLTVNHLNVTNGGLGANITFSTDTTFNDLSTYDTGGLYGSGGVWLDGVFATTFNTVTVYGGEAWGIDMWNATYTNITDYTLTNSLDLASVWDASAYTNVADMTMFDYSAGIFAGVFGPGLADTAFTDVSMTDFEFGLGFGDSTTTSFTSVTATGSLGGPAIELDGSVYTTVTQLSAADGTLGAAFVDSDYSTVTTATASDLSVAVFAEASDYTTVSGVTATDPTSSSPWSAPTAGLPATAAVEVAGGEFTSVASVQATDYPAAYYDIGSYEPNVADLNATGGMYALVLNGTSNGLFTDIGAYEEFVGAQLSADAIRNVITLSSFVDSTSYGVSILAGIDNTVYDNNFIGDNGATSTYNAAHIQSFPGTGGTNYFDGSVTIGVDLGNYWADWHTYDASGNLAPYPLANGFFDHYPIGAPEGTVGVFFEESGLPSGVSWSVTLNGVQQTTSSDVLVFAVHPGSYLFTVGNVAGYSVTPTSGTVTASGVAVYEYVTYSATYTVNLVETGLSNAAVAAGWSATLGGTMVTGNTSSLSFTVAVGSYEFQVAPVAGYTVSPASGVVSVVNRNYVVLVEFTPVTYAVTVTETGLANGASWSATVNGNTIPSTGSSITFDLANGTYSIQISNVSGYTLSSGTVTVTVHGAPTGASVTYTPISTPSYVKTSDFNNWLAVLIAIAVIALVIGLLALLLRGRKEPPTQGAQAWTPPPAQSVGAPAGGAPPASGGSSSWSEGPPSGGPPSS